MVFGAALAVRLAIVAFGAASLQWPDPGSEIAWIARNLAADRGFSSPLGIGTTPTAWVAPAVPAAWSLLFRAFGEMTRASLLGVFVLNAVASAVAAAAYWLLFRSFTGALGGALVKLVLCFLPVCLWPFELKMVTSAWYYCLQEAGLAVILVVVLRWRDSGLAARWTVALALAVAFLSYVNPSPLIVLAGIIPAVVLSVRGAHRFRAVVLFVILVAACLLPWTVRNYWMLGKIVPMRSSFGIELQQGNTEEGSVRQNVLSRHPALRQDERALYDKLGEGLYMERAFSVAADYVLSHPLETIGRTLGRVYVFWCSDITGRWDWQGERKWREGPVARQVARGCKIAAYNLPWVLAVIMLVLKGGGTGRETWLVAWVALLYPLPYYFTHVSPEYAYPVHPYLLMYAMSALARGSAARSDANGLPG